MACDLEEAWALCRCVDLAGGVREFCGVGVGGETGGDGDGRDGDGDGWPLCVVTHVAVRVSGNDRSAGNSLPKHKYY